MATTLDVSPQTVGLTVGQTQVINITTNAGSFTSSISDNSVISFDSATKTVKALKEGTANLTITAKNGTDSAVNAIITVSVVQLTTSLTVTPMISSMEIGEKQSIIITTNGDSYSWNVDNPSVITIDKTNNTLLAVSAGTATVTITAKKTNYKDNTVVLNITVKQEAGTPVKLNLYNKHTGRITTIQTSNNESTKDEVFTLPESSGTLLTEEALSSSVTVITQPKIVTPVSGATDVEEDIVATNFATILGFSGKHTETEWQFATDEKFQNIVLTKYAYSARGHRMTSTSPSLAMTTLYVRVRYKSDTNVSNWSDTIKITTKLCGPAGPQTVLRGSCITAAYFGELTYDQCVPDDAPRRYIGNWETLVKIAANYDYLTNQNGLGDDLVNALKGSQVSYNGKLYYAAKYLRSDTAEFTVTPGTDDTKWVEDTRETLDTPKQVVYNTGLGYNARPNALNGNLVMKNSTYWHRDPYPNSDKPSTLPNYIYPWGMKGTDSTTIPTEYDIPKCSWLKFGYKGKILYIPKVPLLASIAWNDIAKVHGVYGDKTLRIGSRLYYIRLMKEDEYRTLLVGLTNGTLATLNSSELDIDVNTVTSTNIFKEGLKHWIEDFREGTNRKVITGGSGNITVTDMSPRLAGGVYRPVLELIPEGDEPYNNLPDHPTCYDENFRYDKYTDTGYFGRIKATNFIDGATLATEVGLTAGTAYLTNYDWLKFYWRGSIVLIPMSPERYNVSWSNINDVNCVYGVDLGGKGRTDVKVNGYTYSVCLTEQLRGTPSWNDNTTRDRTTRGGIASPSTSDREWAHAGRANWNGMVMCLLNRITGYNIKNRGFFYATDENTYSESWCPVSNGHQSEFGAYQVGDNWEEFDWASLIVNYNQGSGTAFWSSYLCTNYIASNTTPSTWSNDLNRNETSSFSWYHGVSELCCAHVPTFSTASHGWRPCLYLKS